MKYILKRDNYNNNNLEYIFEATDKIYDGSWGDTFVGNLFSFIGKKIKGGVDKGKMKTLLVQLKNELERIHIFSVIEDNLEVQKYDVYENIVTLKKLLRSDDINKHMAIDYIETFVEEANKSTEDKGRLLPEPIKKAHKEVAKKMQILLDFCYSNYSLYESLYYPLFENFRIDLNKEGLDKNLAEPIDILLTYSNSNLIKLYNKFENTNEDTTNDVQFSKIKITGNQKGYKEYIQYLPTVCSNLAKNLSEVIPYVDTKEVKKELIELVDDIYSLPYNDYTSFAKSWELLKRKIKSLIKKSDVISGNKEKEKSKSNIRIVNNKIDKLLSDNDNLLHVIWKSKDGTREINGVANKKALDFNIFDKKNNIIQDKWLDMLDDLKKTQEHQFKSVVIDKNGQLKITLSSPVEKSDRIIKIGNVTIGHGENTFLDNDNDIDGVGDNSDVVSEDKDFIQLLIEKTDEVFDNDKVYKEAMTISDAQKKDLYNSIKTKAQNGEQSPFVDPIAILRIFNRAYNKFGISKDEYNNFSNKFRPKVAQRKMNEYELVGNRARHKKLFNQWNDGVLQLLQNYSDTLDKNTKKFIIKMLDGDDMFDKRGLQTQLLSDFFGVELDEKARKSLGFDTSNVQRKSSEKTSDNSVAWESVSNIEINHDKIKRVPFVMECVNEADEVIKIVCMPVKANRSKDNNRLTIKYTENNDAGFLDNYILDDVDLNEDSFNNIQLNREDDTDVKIGTFVSEYDILETGNKYRFINSENIMTNDTFPKDRYRIKNIWMLMGEKDNKIYRTPVLNKKIKDALDKTTHDKNLNN